MASASEAQSSSQQLLFTRFHGRQRRSSLLSRFDNACSLAIPPALLSSQADSSPPLRRCVSLSSLHSLELDRCSQISSNDNEMLGEFRPEEDRMMWLSDGGMNAFAHSCDASLTHQFPVSQPECGVSPSRRLSMSQVSRSLSSPAELFYSVDSAYNVLNLEETVFETPPGKILSDTRGAPPTPRVPQKAHGSRPGHLGKKQPRKLQFGGTEGWDFPENARASSISPMDESSGSATMNRYSGEWPCKCDSRGGGVLRSANNVGEAGQTLVASPPKTPPNELFNSFTSRPTPAAPKKVPKRVLGSSLSHRERRS